MAGAPDEERTQTTSGSARVRRLAWAGYAALALAVLLLTVGLSRLASWSSFVAGSAEPSGGTGNDAPAIAAEVIVNSDRDDLPPSIRRYLDSTPYPPSMGRLTSTHGDLLNPNARHEDFRPIPETFSQDPNEIISVRLTSDRYFYEGDDPITLRLDMRQGSEAREPLSIAASAIREGRAGTKGNPSPLRFRRSGAGDSSGYTADLDTARFADHHGPILVEARLEYQSGVFHDESLRLFLTPEGRIPARFTGEIEDRLANGSLRVEIGIDVEQAGFYRIDANLYDRSGRPVAYSAWKGELDRNDKTIPIEFFGRLLLDVGGPSPYSVGEVRGYRFIDGGYPDRERIPDLPGRHATRDYTLSQLSPDEYMGPEKLRMVELLMEDVARGIAIEAPPLPPSASMPASAAPGAAPLAP